MDNAQYYIDSTKAHKERYSGEGAEERWLNDMYGEDWRDAKYMKDVYEVDDVKKHARDEIKMEMKGAVIERDMMVSLYVNEAKKYMDQMQRMMSATSLDDFSKAELKEMEKLSKEYLKDNKKLKM